MAIPSRYRFLTMAHVHKKNGRSAKCYYESARHDLRSGLPFQSELMIFHSKPFMNSAGYLSNPHGYDHVQLPSGELT